MAPPHFTLADLAAECRLETGSHRLDGRALGLRITVPAALQTRYPYNAPVYHWLQQLRQAIFEYGLIELPDLAFNRCNYTLAQRAPWQHGYSDNPYLTDYCQAPHQDTPPYPTAFGLPAARRHFATWVVSDHGLAQFAEAQRRQPGLGMDTLHRQLVPQTLAAGHGLLVNCAPGLLLLDNSDHQRLYHARTCRFETLAERADETPMYAFNEIGLLHYLDRLDSRRGPEARDAREADQVRAYLAAEKLAG